MQKAGDRIHVRYGSVVILQHRVTNPIMVGSAQYRPVHENKNMHIHCSNLNVYLMCFAELRSIPNGFIVARFQGNTL